MTDSHEIGRRGFVKVVVGFISTLIGAIIGLPAIAYLISPALKVEAKEAWIPAGPLENYPIGTPTLFSFSRTTVNGWERTVNSYGAYVVRINSDQHRVFSNMCTHLSCRVTWKEEIQEYLCPCHDGHFSPDGRVTAGPPPKALVEYETKIEEGNLLLHFVEG